MPTSTWGRPMWYVIHSWAFSFPTEPTGSDIDQALAYYNNLPNIIPCPSCANSFAEILQSDPVNVESRADLVEWTWRIHNAVNTKLGKPSYSIDDFINHYGVTFSGDEPVAPIMTRAMGSVFKFLYRAWY